MCLESSSFDDVLVFQLILIILFDTHCAAMLVKFV